MEIKRFSTQDIFQKNECLRFDLAEAAFRVEVVPKIGAVSIICRDVDSNRSLEAMDNACIEHARAILFDEERFNLFLFLAHAPWQSKSAMVKHNKLWKSFPKTQLLGQCNLSQELMIESREGLRFAGVAKIDSDHLVPAMNILRHENHSAAMILSSRDDISTLEGIRALYDAAFPTIGNKGATRLDLLNLALKVCPLGDVVVRMGGTLDDRETSIDLLMESYLITTFDR